jgi:hypothetical protein
MGSNKRNKVHECTVEDSILIIIPKLYMRDGLRTTLLSKVAASTVNKLFLREVSAILRRNRVLNIRAMASSKRYQNKTKGKRLNDLHPYLPFSTLKKPSMINGTKSKV